MDIRIPANIKTISQSRRHLLAFVAVGVLAAQNDATAWWSNGHECISTGVLQNLSGTGDLNRFFTEVNDVFVKIPKIEPAGTHYIDIDTPGSPISYATDFANFRAGTFSFPTSRTAANARYGASYLSNNGDVPWRATDSFNLLTIRMQNASSYNDWYQLLQTAGSLAHYLEDMHNPMHLTRDYNGIPPDGLHSRYEGQQFEEGSVNRYQELRNSMTPVAPIHYSDSAAFINALFNRIPTDYDRNVTIRTANSTHGSLGYGTVAYNDAMWNATKAFTKDSFQDSAVNIASAFYSAYRNAGSPVIPQPTFYATPANECSTIRSAGPVSGYINVDYVQVNGSSSYSVLRYDMSRIKSQYDAMYGTGNWIIDNILLSTESTSTSTGLIKCFYSPDDLFNIQSGSSLRFADNASPLGVNVQNDSPIFEFSLASQSIYNILRYNSLAGTNWNQLLSDITSGGTVTLVMYGATSTTNAAYFSGNGASLEVYAHALPEPISAGWLGLSAIILLNRRMK